MPSSNDSGSLEEQEVLRDPEQERVVAKAREQAKAVAEEQPGQRQQGSLAMVEPGGA